MAEHIGTRIRYWRTRRSGMSQTVLAGLAGVSQAFISQVENGLRPVERRKTLVALAGALQVSVADLVGDLGDPTDPQRECAAAAIPAVRVALVAIEEGDRQPPTRGREEMAAAVEELSELRAGGRHAEGATRLPTMLPDAAAYGGLHQAQVAYDAASCLKNLGYRDLALSAARLAVAAAQQAEDPAWIGAAEYMHTVTLPIEAPEMADRLATRTLTELQGRAGEPRARAMLGQLHLSASLACAAQQRADDAAAHLAEAGREARTLGDPEDGAGFNLLCYGPTNVGLWRLAVLAELGEYGELVDTARRIQPHRLRIADRHYSYWLNLGRALAHSGRTDHEALVAFINAERAAPVPFSVNQMARDSVASIVHRARRRAVSADLRLLARRVGIDAA